MNDSVVRDCFTAGSCPLDLLQHSHDRKILLCRCGCHWQNFRKKIENRIATSSRQDRWKLILCEDNFVVHHTLIC